MVSLRVLLDTTIAGIASLTFSGTFCLPIGIKFVAIVEVVNVIRRAEYLRYK